MVKYYPKKRMLINRKTAGEEFIKDGKPYQGTYWLDYQGTPYPGANPLLSDNIPLQRTEGSSTNSIKSTDIQYDEKTIADYLEARKITIQDLVDYIEPIPEYPKPTELDYQRGAFTRYFTKKIGTNNGIIEISKPVYDSINKKEKLFDYSKYEVVDIFWQITGPLKDDRKNKTYKTAGILDTNKRLVESKEKVFKGLKDYIGDEYDKFARVT